MNIALIVAAGTGTRIKTPMAKQYLPLAGIPIITRTLRTFSTCRVVDAILLVIAAADRRYCEREIIAPMQLSKPISVVDGGATRQESVNNGLAAMESDNHWVIVHDGVRPFVTTAQIEACLDKARSTGACILAVPAVETLKEVDDDNIIRRTRHRKGIWLAQTPQIFKLAELRKAHNEAQRRNFVATDDAALMELIDKPVSVITGSRRNIKITTAEDLSLAEAMIENDSAG